MTEKELAKRYWPLCLLPVFTGIVGAVLEDFVWPRYEPKVFIWSTVLGFVVAIAIVIVKIRPERSMDESR